jgi:hypothetical protein
LPIRASYAWNRLTGRAARGPGHLARKPRILTVVLDRRQEATLKVKVPAPGLETGSHPKVARRHGQPAPIVAAAPSPRRTISAQGANRATERQRPAPGNHPQPRAEYSGQRDRRGDQA